MELTVITAAPFALALFLTLPQVRAFLSKTAQTWLSTLVMAVLFLWLVSSVPRLQETEVIIQGISWIPSLGIRLSFYLDGLSLLFALIITGVGALIFFYAGYYFDDAE